VEVTRMTLLLVAAMKKALSHHPKRKHLRVKVDINEESDEGFIADVVIGNQDFQIIDARITEEDVLEFRLIWTAYPAMLMVDPLSGEGSEYDYDFKDDLWEAGHEIGRESATPIAYKLSDLNL
jgi:hypothetical protein